MEAFPVVHLFRGVDEALMDSEDIAYNRYQHASYWMQQLSAYSATVAAAFAFL
jgi:hypothetical protein